MRAPFRVAFGVLCRKIQSLLTTQSIQVYNSAIRRKLLSPNSPNYMHLARGKGATLFDCMVV